MRAKIHFAKSIAPPARTAAGGRGRSAPRPATENEYRLLFELNPNPMWIFDEDTLQFLAVNEAAIALYGWSRKEFMRMTIMDVRPPHEAPRVLEALRRQCGARPAFAGHWRHWKKDRTLLEVEATISRIRFQGRDARLSMVKDVTARRRAEAALRERDKQLQTDLRAMAELHELGRLTARPGNMRPVLARVVEAAIAIAGADFGNIQLLDEASGDLRIAAQRGFPKWWTAFWNQVSKAHGVCGTALERGRRVIVEDVKHSPIFAGTRALKIQLKAGVRAVQSTPLVSRSGRVLGMFSTHYRTPRRPDERTLQMLDFLARQAADLIERVQAEDALRASERRYRSLFENDLTGNYVAKPDGTIVLCNPAFAQVFGFANVKAAIGASLSALHWPPESWSACVRRLRQGKRARRHEREARRRDGSRLHIVERVVGSFDRQDALAQVQGYVFDNSERKRAEAALKELNATLERRITERTAEVADTYDRLRAILDSAVVGILTLDERGRIEATNATGAKLFGYLPTELIGRNFDELIVPPHAWERATFLGRYARPDELRIRGLGRTITGRCKNGQERVLELSMNDFNRAGRRHFVITARDVTTRKQLENELLEIGERERQQLGRELHDGLGQHLHGLYYMASLLERDTKQASPALAREAERMARQLRHALELTRGLAHGLQPVSDVPEGLMTALHELARRARELYRVDCRFQCRQPVLIPGHSAANHLYRIAQEALNNAMKHGRPSRLRIHLSATPDRIILGVRDNGVGIRLRTGRGPGMGLHIMQYRTEALRGSLIVRRQPRGGTEVICSMASRALLPREDGLKQRPAQKRRSTERNVRALPRPL